MGRVVRFHSTSTWWKIVPLLEFIIEYSFDWIADNILKKVRYDFLTSFWKDPWIGLTLLIIKFPRLYSITDQQGWHVAAFGVVKNEIVTL